MVVKVYCYPTYVYFDTFYLTSINHVHSLKSNTWKIVFQNKSIAAFRPIKLRNAAMEYRKNDAILNIDYPVRLKQPANLCYLRMHARVIISVITGVEGREGGQNGVMEFNGPKYRIH